MTTTGLVRVTIAAPQRRMDMALPQASAVAELLPGLLRHAGEGLADAGVAGGGWVLRRPDGTAVDGGGSLGAHRVRDGEVLHLVPRRVQWPELEYDDLVDAIAGGAARTGRLWSPQHTRLAGLAAGGVCVLLGLVAVLRAGPPWPWPGLVALGVALLLLAAATALARALGDAGAGSALAAMALPHAFAGGWVLLAGSLPLGGFGAPQLLAGCAALLVASVLGYFGVVDRPALFVAGATVGLLGGVAAWTATAGSVGGAGAAAIVSAAALVFSPLLGPLAVRLGRLPMPVLPRSAADLVRDDPHPPRRAVYAAVLRTDGLLTGMLAGSALVAALCAVVLAVNPGTPAIVLLAVVSAGFAVRARLYPAVRQRVPLLAAALTGAACLLAGPLMDDPATLLRIAVPAVLAVAAVAVLLGLTYSKRSPGAYVGRYAELLEVVLVLGCVPLVCWVLDLYSLLRGLAG